MKRRSSEAPDPCLRIPNPGDRDELFLVLGERHQPLDPIPAVYPQWLSVPERGLYTGTIAVGAIGSGKTRGLILPATHQLFGYRPTTRKRSFPASSWRSRAIFAGTCQYLKQQLEQKGITYQALENGILSCEDPQALQGLCDRLSESKIDTLLRKWLRRLPHPFARQDRQAGYRYQLSILQIELFLTQVLDHPVSGRIFFEDLKT